MNPTTRTTTAATPFALLAAGVLALSACTVGAGTTTSTGDASNASGPAADPADPKTLRVLAGSEIKDMEPVLAEAQKATGVRVVLTYAGTLDGAEQAASGRAGANQDATWFASNRYLGLLPGGSTSVTSPTKIMSSPVILGVKQSTAKTLGWDRTSPTWAQIGAAVAAKKLTYGMTNPASSNSGFSALVGVATAYAGGGKAIDAQRIDAVTPQLKTFFAGQKLTSGSSGWLAERYAADQGTVDGLINYESVLLDLNARKATPEPLTLVYPKDGIVSGDYPLSLLSVASAKADSFRALTDWLRSPAGQQKIMEQTHRRPVVPGVRLAPEFGDHLLVELPFPAQVSAANGLITAYLNDIRRPSQTVYVLDVSGSMEGERLTALKTAFAQLSGQGAQGADTFTTFRTRERVTILPFSSDSRPPQTVDVPDKAPDAALGRIRSTVDGLDAGGSTALFTALDAGYEQARAAVAAAPDTFTSIVLMTDGERTAGMGPDEFLQRYRALDPATRAVPTFAVLFGDSSPEELSTIATATGGKVFDARRTSLAQIFKEIRGYQ